MPQKPPIKRKVIQDAIKAEYNFFWQRVYGEWYQLYAVTFTYENGGLRRKKLYSTTLQQEARDLNAELVKQGVRIEHGLLEKIIRTPY